MRAHGCIGGWYSTCADRKAWLQRLLLPHRRKEGWQGSRATSRAVEARATHARKTAAEKRSKTLWLGALPRCRAQPADGLGPHARTAACGWWIL